MTLLHQARSAVQEHSSAPFWNEIFQLNVPCLPAEVKIQVIEPCCRVTLTISQVIVKQLRQDVTMLEASIPLTQELVSCFMDEKLELQLSSALPNSLRLPLDAEQARCKLRLSWSYDVDDVNIIKKGLWPLTSEKKCL